MPEVAEVAHACALLKRNIIGLTIRKATLPLDNLIFPQLKLAEDPSDEMKRVERQLLDATVTNTGRHGKYFWLRLRTAQRESMVILMHFGMTGMIKMRGIDSHMILMENGGDKIIKAEKSKVKIEQSVEEPTAAEEGKTEEGKTEEGKTEEDKTEEVAQDQVDIEEWPPRFTKFELLFTDQQTAPRQSGMAEVDLAFKDPRRLARVRFLFGDEYSTDEQLLQMAPLRALGPDYSKKREVDEAPAGKKFVRGDPDPHHHGRPRPDFVTFAKLVLTKKKPIKALLLDQDQFAGIGNWVSDEVLFHARIHPSEILSGKISDPYSPVLQRLYESIIYIMEESVRVEGNAREFPSDWLMLHRWGKGRKHPKAKVEGGYSVEFQTIGGRTSCFVPDLQKPLPREPKAEGKDLLERDEKIKVEPKAEGKDLLERDEKIKVEPTAEQEMVDETSIKTKTKKRAAAGAQANEVMLRAAEKPKRTRRQNAERRKVS